MVRTKQSVAARHADRQKTLPRDLLHSPVGSSTPFRFKKTKRKSNDVEPPDSPAPKSRRVKSINLSKSVSHGESNSRRRARRGTRALQEIRFYQKTLHFLIPRLSFCRLVKEIIRETGEFRIQSLALEALQTAAEAFAIRFLEEANICAIHAKRVTLMQKDMRLVRYLKHGADLDSKPLLN